MYCWPVIQFLLSHTLGKYLLGFSVFVTPKRTMARTKVRTVPYMPARSSNRFGRSEQLPVCLVPPYLFAFLRRFSSPFSARPSRDRLGRVPGWPCSLLWLSLWLQLANFSVSNLTTITPNPKEEKEERETKRSYNEVMTSTTFWRCIAKCSRLFSIELRSSIQVACI